VEWPFEPFNEISLIKSRSEQFFSRLAIKVVQAWKPLKYWKSCDGSRWFLEKIGLGPC
jgi:hypothetical protein